MGNDWGVPGYTVGAEGSCGVDKGVSTDSLRESRIHKSVCDVEDPGSGRGYTGASIGKGRYGPTMEHGGYCSDER